MLASVNTMTDKARLWHSFDYNI